MGTSVLQCLLTLKTRPLLITTVHLKTQSGISINFSVSWSILELSWSSSSCAFHRQVGRVSPYRLVIHLERIKFNKLTNDGDSSLALISRWKRCELTTYDSVRSFRHSIKPFTHALLSWTHLSWVYPRCWCRRLFDPDAALSAPESCVCYKCTCAAHSKETLRRNHIDWVRQ